MCIIGFVVPAYKSADGGELLKIGPGCIPVEGTLNGRGFPTMDKQYLEDGCLVFERDRITLLSKFLDGPVDEAIFPD